MGWLVMLAVLMMTFTGCGSGAVPALPTLPPSAVVAHAIEVRASIGLRADRAWVEAVESEPDSVVRQGIKVTPAEAADLDERFLEDQLEKRDWMGLSTDPAWVRSVIANPDAVTRGMDVLLAPEEAAAYDRRVAVEDDLKQALAYYSAQHRDEWAGSYRDGDTIVTRFTGSLEEHRAALAALIDPTFVTVEVQGAKWTLEALQANRNRLRDDYGWFKAHGRIILSTDIDVPTNRVVLELELSAPDPDIAARLLVRYDASAWLTIRTSVDAAASLAFGRLTVMVVDGTGRPLVGLMCKVVPKIPGAQGDNALSIADEQGRCRWGEGSLLGATSYRVEVWRRLGVDLLGFGAVSVPANGEANLTITIAGG
ncbi:MAG: hypothetical protein ACYC65_10585 [Candidatus Limnocylindrales bacterium]